MPEPEDKKIIFLVVDDQFNVRRMIHNFLRTFGYTRVTEAPDGEKALETLEEGGVGFVISDWNMPRMNGLELLRRVRADERWRSMPFLMVTAEVMEQTVAEAIEESVDGYIVKPFQARTLVDKIESVLDKRRSPDPLELALRQGYDHLDAGRLPQAHSQFGLALELNPASPRALLAMGEVLEKAGSLDEAKDRYLAAVETSPRFVKAHDRLAALYHRMGQTDLATTQLAKAARISPRNPRRQVDMGKLLLAQGKTGEGLLAIRSALQAAARDPNLAAEVGDILLAAGLNEEAILAFQTAATLNPRMAHVYNRLGIAYRRQRRFDDAAREYKRALALTPQDENLLFNLAVAQAEAGHRDLAVESLGQALRLRPDFGEARALLQRLS